MPHCDECLRLLKQRPGDPLIAHLMVAHQLTLREAELHAEILLAEAREAAKQA